MKKTPFDKLPLIPSIVAEAVCGRVYTCIEFSPELRPFADIERTEAARQKMTPEQVTEFAERCDEICRAAYEANRPWFLKCVHAKDNSGRDQLYVWVSHWLASYLLNPKRFIAHTMTFTFSYNPPMILNAIARGFKIALEAMK